MSTGEEQSNTFLLLIRSLCAWMLPSIASCEVILLTDIFATLLFHCYVHMETVATLNVRKPQTIRGRKRLLRSPQTAHWRLSSTPIHTPTHVWMTMLS